MEKNNEVLKLEASLSKHGSPDFYKVLEEGVKLTLAPSKEEKKDWVEFICRALENRYPEETLKKIRMACHCTETGNLEESKKMIEQIYLSSDSLESFVAHMNEKGAEWFIDNQTLFTQYFSCSCPMLDSVEILSTKTWCYCTLGFNKAIFESVFGCEVEIDLIESIKMGDSRCLVKIMPSKNPFDPNNNR